jgi:hypothetical protein
MTSHRSFSPRNSRLGRNEDGAVWSALGAFLALSKDKSIGGLLGSSTQSVRVHVYISIRTFYPSKCRTSMPPKSSSFMRSQLHPLMILFASLEENTLSPVTVLLWNLPHASGKTVDRSIAARTARDSSMSMALRNVKKVVLVRSR